MHTLKKAAMIGLYALLGVALVLGGVTLLERVDPSGRMTLGFKPLIVAGGSMEPSIHAGSLLMIRRVDPSSIAVGDIITYTESAAGDGDGLLTTHRVTSISAVDGSPAFRTRGDANNAGDDQDVPASAVLGRAVFAVPYVGNLRAILASKVGLALLIILCVGIAINEAISLKKAMQADEFDATEKART